MREDLDLPRQTSIIQDALASFGIASEFSGRNDLLIQGRKFSGSAYYYSSTSCYHHGTLMVDVDLARAVRYLNVSAAKLKANGVSSVRSRIINLKEANPDLTVERLRRELIRSWQPAPFSCRCSHPDPGSSRAPARSLRSRSLRSSILPPSS